MQTSISGFPDGLCGSYLSDPAVDEDLAARHEAAIVGRQEGDDFRNLPSRAMRSSGALLAA
jgi:hypothetical protein